MGGWGLVARGAFASLCNAGSKVFFLRASHSGTLLEKKSPLIWVVLFPWKTDNKHTH